MLLVIQYQEACERAAVPVCTALWRPAHLPACSECVRCPQQHPKAGWCWRWSCWLAGTCGRCWYYRHCATLHQTTLSTNILGGCWIGVSPSQTKYKAVLRKVLSAFYCELKVLAPSSGARAPSSSYLCVKNFKLFWVALENLFAVET